MVESGQDEHVAKEDSVVQERLPREERETKHRAFRVDLEDGPDDSNKADALVLANGDRLLRLRERCSRLLGYPLGSLNDDLGLGTLARG